MTSVSVIEEELYVYVLALLADISSMRNYDQNLETLKLNIQHELFESLICLQEEPVLPHFKQASRSNYSEDRSLHLYSMIFSILV